MIQRLGDSLTNLVSGLGTDRDQAVATTYVLTHLTDDQIYAAYKTAWLPEKIVNIPAFDSLRATRRRAFTSGRKGCARVQARG